MTDSPFSPSGISVTIKSDEPGGKFNDPKSPGSWIVFHGTVASVRDQIIEAFELDASNKDRALYDLVNEATKIFKAVNKVGQQLGGTVLSAGPKTEEPKSQPGWEGDDVFAQARESAATPPAQEEKSDVDPILAALENCKTRAEVQQVWAENQSAFNNNPEYMSAYKARGKALA